jgi:hypothetical protein
MRRGSKALTEKLMTEKSRGIAVKSHLFAISFSVSRTLRMDAAALGIACGEGKSFTPPIHNPPLISIGKRRVKNWWVKNGSFQSLVAASPRCDIPGISENPWDAVHAVLLCAKPASRG